MSPAERIYLDHNATTPLRAEVVDLMVQVLRDEPGNPSSTHAEGAVARQRVAEARAAVAACLGCRPGHVLFTGGATESNNTVVHCVLSRAEPGRNLVTSRVEHPSVVAPAEWLEKQGAPVRWVEVDEDGRVRPEALLEAVDEHTALVSLIWANNETGVVQPIEEIAEALAARGVPFHVDATQAVGKWPVDLSTVPITYLSSSAHKLNGPKGVGCLAVAEDAPIEPILMGGPQERRLRGGTENVAGIAGFGRACALAMAELSDRMIAYAALRDRLWSGLEASIPDVRRNGSAEHVLPNTLSVEFTGTAGDVLVEALDLEGIAVSAGAACHSGSVSPSHVLTAMGRSVDEARASLRLSVGHGNDPAQIDRAVRTIAALVARSRGAA